VSRERADLPADDRRSPVARLSRFGGALARAIVQPTTGSAGYWTRLSSMIAPGGWIYRDAHYLVADVELDPCAARRFVPFPLRLASPARGQVFTSYFPYTTFGSVYREAGVFFEVVSPLGIHAVYSPWMLVDDDVALIMGRELLGYPKKLGDFTWQHAGDAIRTSAHRRGAELIAMEGTLGERLPSPPPMLGRPHRNVRTSAGLALPKLVAFTPHERVIEVRSASLAVRITGSERDPLHELGLGRVLGARLHRVDLGGARPPLPIAIASPIALARHLLLRSH
jgi:acetoacetate decarboxylase